MEHLFSLHPNEHLFNHLRERKEIFRINPEKSTPGGAYHAE